jgi:hypothetical protein
MILFTLASPSCPQAAIHETTGLPAHPNHVAELAGDQKYAMQSGRADEVLPRTEAGAS